MFPRINFVIFFNYFKTDLLEEYHWPLEYPPPPRVLAESYVNFAVTAATDVCGHSRGHRVRHHQTYTAPFDLIPDQVSGQVPVRLTFPLGFLATSLYIVFPLQGRVTRITKNQSDGIYNNITIILCENALTSKYPQKPKYIPYPTTMAQNNCTLNSSKNDEQDSRGRWCDNCAGWCPPSKYICVCAITASQSPDIVWVCDHSSHTPRGRRSWKLMSQMRPIEKKKWWQSYSGHIIIIF